MTFLYTGKGVKFPKWSKENYFLAIKKIVEEYPIKLDYDINILSKKSYKELSFIYREMQIQLKLGGPRKMAFGRRNYGNNILSERGGRRL
jgi:hypothetical protein